MKEFFSTWKFKVIVLLVLIGFGAMLHTGFRSGVMSGVESVMGILISPFQKLSQSISRSATGFFSKWAQVDEIIAENEALRAEIDRLNKQMIDYEDIKDENEQYKVFYEVKEQNPDFSTMNAVVIGRDVNNRFGSFMIDQGSMHGIKAGSPVLNEQGLIGIITDVGMTHSKVTTILSPRIEAGCFSVSSRDTGILRGDVNLYQDGLCLMEHISRESDIEIGDLIVTSGSGGVYPKNQVIGKVTEVGLSDSGMTKYAVIRPEADIEHVDNVIVITEFAGQGEVRPDAPVPSVNGSASDKDSVSDKDASSETAADAVQNGENGGKEPEVPQ